jgi:hypothetical protein
MNDSYRHPLDHGWVTAEGYLCDGCNVLGLHEHRCHRDDAGPKCVCGLCAEPTPEELAAFAAALERKEPYGA